MWRKNTARLLVLTLTSLLLYPGCATLTRKKSQRIPVTSSPVGAAVIVNGVQRGVTPLEIRLTRKEKSQVIRIESPGYNPVEIRPKRKMSDVPKIGNFCLGLLLGLVPAVGVGLSQEAEHWNGDMVMVLIGSGAALFGIFTLIDSGGAGYELEPKELTVTLTKADGTIRVDKMLVDADAFRNIKWIRVR
jgi:hypothetical protein